MFTALLISILRNYAYVKKIQQKIQFVEMCEWMGPEMKSNGGIKNSFHSQQWRMLRLNDMLKEFLFLTHLFVKH